MDIKAYIESGILESYVMGLATEAQSREVEKYASEFPEIRRELNSIEEALNRYALHHQKTPPAHIKAKILSEIISDNTKNVQEAKVIDINTGKQKPAGFKIYWAAASVALLILSLAGNYMLYQKWQKAQNEVTALNNEKSVLAEQFQTQKANYDQMGHEMEILKQPFNKVVAMKGILSVSPNSLATVYWNQDTKEVFLNVNSLPSPPEGKQYQLWAIADGKAIDAGVFDVGDSVGVQKMKIIDNAQAFAVTLEKKGGVPKAEGPMFVMGNI